jgi:enterochelin esterase-like enzyme
MKFPRPVLCLFLTMSALGTINAADRPAEKVTWNNPVTFTEPGLSHQTFSSASMGIEVGYSVWLPPGYETSGIRYPVIYFLHGTGGTESADSPAFSHMLAIRLEAGKIAPAICVFPNGGVSGYRDHSESNVKVETMIIKELIPLIDQKYRTRPGRMSRVIGGFSMGGGGAVRLALTHPDLFSAAASWAGAFVRHEQDGKFTPDFDAALLKPSSEPVRLLLIVGYEDITYPWHAAAVEALLAAKYSFTYHTIAGLKHELGRYYDLTGDELIDFLAKDFPAQPKA